MSDKSVLAKFNAEMFGKASYFCSRTNWRENLHGVYVFRSDFGGVHLVATNAFHVVFFYDQDGYSNLDELYIPIKNEFTKFSRKASNKNNSIELISGKNLAKSFDQTGDKMHLRLNGVDFSIPFNDKSKLYPKEALKKVVPEIQSYKKISASYNIDYLKKLTHLKLTNKKYQERSKECAFSNKFVFTTGKKKELMIAGLNVFYMVMPLASKNAIPIKELIYQLTMKNNDILSAAIHKKNINQIFESISLKVNGSYYDSLNELVK